MSLHVLDDLDENVLSDVIQDVMDCRYIPFSCYISKRWTSSLGIESTEQCQGLFEQLKTICKEYIYSSSSQTLITNQLQSTLNEQTCKLLLSILSQKRSEWISDAIDNKLSPGALVGFECAPMSTSLHTGVSRTQLQTVQMSMQVQHTPKQSGGMGNITDLCIDLDQIALDRLLHSFRRLRKQLSTI